MIAPSHSVAEVFNAFGDGYLSRHHLSFEQQKVMSCIRNCRTAALGGHWQACQNCGCIERHYNSCGNRHCPSCQGVNKERWVLERSYDLLPVKYFHVVFTVPSELRDLFYQNQKPLYNLLFRSAWETLKEFAHDKRQHMQANIGTVSILHTWTQKLVYHPHIHCIVPNGGIGKDNKWKKSKGNGEFLFYVPTLALKFRGKFLDNLYKLFLSGELKLEGKLQAIKPKAKFYGFKDKLYHKKWVINCKKPFNGPKSVLEYLGRYTHKIAIGNYRIVNIDKEKKEVTFSFLDRNDNNKKKQLVLPADKFIGRFLQHVLPKGFVRIRHHGILACRVKKQNLKIIRGLLNAPDVGEKAKLSVRDVMIQTMGIDPFLCKSCKSGIMVVFETIPKSRGQPTGNKVPA